MDETTEQIAEELDHSAVHGSMLTFWQRFSYSLGEMGVSLSPAIVVSWFIYFYTGRPVMGADPNTGEAIQTGTLFLVSPFAIGLLGLIGRLVDSVADPLVGFYSDKWHFKMGRRIPWVVFGTPFLILFSILLWFPPDGEGMGQTLFSINGMVINANFLWLAFNISAFWFFYTVVVAPYLSLLPEITPYNDERLKVSELMAYQDVVGMIIGSIAVGVLIDAFSGGWDLGFVHFTNGYQVAGVLIGVLFGVTFYMSIGWVREKPVDETKVVPFNILEAAKHCVANPSFLPYIAAVSFLRLSVDILVALIPFMVVNLMGLSESLAGIMQGIIVLAAAFAFPFVSRQAAKHGKKKILELGLLTFSVGMVAMGAFYHFPFIGYAIKAVAGLFGKELSIGWVQFLHCVFVLFGCAFSIGTVLVLPRPIYADVMDFDAERTGYRREAMYNGMEGLITKFAAGVAVFIVPQLISILGARPDKPWGPLAGIVVAALVMIAAWLSMRPYPIEK